MQRDNCGREEAKRNTSEQERKHCFLIPFHHNNKQANKQANKGLGAKHYLTESGPQVIMATTGYRNLSCTGGNSLISPRNRPIVLRESFLCPHAEK